jgi:SAM-dependent MidA family methyltransferase
VNPAILISLADRLREQIQRDGPITFHDWMSLALYFEHGGYYKRKDLTRWGPAGDYRTAPERSPLFAATFARYFASLHKEFGSPKTWSIVEAGAGAGHFARGLLRSFRKHHQQIFAATRYVIDEVSKDGRARARQRLSEFVDRIEFNEIVNMAQRNGVGIVFANELLDAFPVHRVIFRAGKLLEFHVGLDTDSQFVWIVREASTPELAGYLERAGVQLVEGQIAEINLHVEEWMKDAASLFKRGYLVLVDYGAEAEEIYNASHRPEGTLRAFQRHKFADDMLARPGEQDLTATIDWSNVKRIGERLGMKLVSFERQDEFLLRSGLLEELERMASESNTEADEVVLRSSVRELILPGGMSESFQVLIQRW